MDEGATQPWIAFYCLHKPIHAWVSQSKISLAGYGHVALTQLDEIRTRLKLSIADGDWVAC